MTNNQVDNSIVINNIDDVLIDVISLLTSSNFCKWFLLIVAMFFSPYLILFSIIFDLETSFLSISVEKAIQKVFRVEIVIERKFVFIAIVFEFLIISSNEIAFQIVMQKKKFKINKFFLRKKIRRTSNNNILMLFRRRCRLTSRN